MALKTRMFEIIEKAKSGDRASRIFDISIILLIVFNIIAVILNSFNDLPESFNKSLTYFEYFSVIVFSTEYLFRLWTADLLFPKSKLPRLKFIVSFMALIDLFAILPFYLPFLIPCDLRFLRILRLFRLFRILKLNRYSHAMTTIGNVFKNEKEKLAATIFITLILLIFSSSVMYYVENEAQPDKFPNIIAAIWWAVATLTTVGYGDVYPITLIGKLFSGIVVILGIGLIALPTGIISSGFITEVNRRNERTKKICPHCGEEIDN